MSCDNQQKNRKNESWKKHHKKLIENDLVWFLCNQKKILNFGDINKYKMIFLIKSLLIIEMIKKWWMQKTLPIFLFYFHFTFKRLKVTKLSKSLSEKALSKNDNYDD
jgi:hypothetical protein